MLTIALMNNGIVGYLQSCRATPHLSAVIALILSANMNLTYDGVYEVLKQAMVQDLLEPTGLGGRRIPIPGWPVRKQCDGSSWTEYPNLFYGYGRVDALKAVELAQQA
jgi:hypothetical protein